MPSKSKKNPKTPTSSSSSSSSTSSSSKFLSLSQNSYNNNNNNNNKTCVQQQSNFDDDDDEVIQKALEKASSKFPTLLSKSSLIAVVSDFDDSIKQKGSTIWLSHSFMLSFSISPGSTVSDGSLWNALCISELFCGFGAKWLMLTGCASVCCGVTVIGFEGDIYSAVTLVSLPSIGRSSRIGLPLSSLLDELSEQLGVDLEREMDDKAGKFFALATAFPSNKLVKNGVRISSHLSYSLGRPTAGRVVFVHPFRDGSFNNFLHSNEKRCDSHMDHPLLCEELYIKPLPFKSWPMEMEASSPSKSLSDKPMNRYENGEVNSPRTPSLNHSRQCPPSPSASNLSLEDSISRLRDTRKSCFDFLEIEEILRDMNAKKLLEHTAVSWLHSRTLLCGNLLMVPVLSKLCFFEVVAMKRASSNGAHEALVNTSQLLQHGDEACLINRVTRINICLDSDLAPKTPELRSSKLSKTTSGDINGTTRDQVTLLGGLRKEHRLLRDIIASSMNNALSSLGLRTTKGVLLYGPPGTGKTSLAQLCAHDAGVSFFKVNGPEIVSQYYGETEHALHDVFKSATEAAPSVIFIDELDAIAPARKEGGDELSQRMVATLLNLMDGISRSEGLLIIAATNRVECIEPALRRPGRLDREIEIGVPSPDQRLDILTTLLGEMEHCLSFDQIQELAVASHGFVGADLAALSNEAGMVCLRRSIMCNKNTDAYVSVASSSSLSNDGALDDYLRFVPSTYTELTVSTLSSDSIAFPINEEGTPKHNTKEVSKENDECSSITQEHIQKINFEDFERARMKIRPSAMREVILEVPKVKWKDVGGQEEVKAQLMEAVEWPQKHQDAFKRIGTRPPTGVLMFGPPGCSKTLMARAVASEAGLNFLAVKGPELFSKWVGESEKAVRSLFAKARANAPSIIFFDEIDSLAVIRGRESDGVSVSDRVMSQLLVELDGLQERVNVTVIAATNRPDKIDTALLRPGRFDRLLYVGPPNVNDRVEVFRIHLCKMRCSSDVDLGELARLTEGCTGADISLVCREAAISALEDNIDASEITMEHLERAILHVQPSEIQPYLHLSEKFQRLVYSKDRTEDIRCHQFSEVNATSPWNPMKWIPRLVCWFAAAIIRQTTSSNG